MTIGDLVSQSMDVLNGAGIEDARSDVIMLISEITGLSSSFIKVSKDYEVNEELSERITDAVKRFSEGEPLAYILGKAYFYYEEYKVGKGVLIPRPDTEILVEQAFNLIRESGISNPVIWDLCTGSGCVGISLSNALHRTGIEPVTYLVDYFDDALRYTEVNLSQNICMNAPRVLKLDVIHDLDKMPGERPDFIVSNPPYITSKDMDELDSSVKDYEPHTALYGLREDGLVFYEVLSRTASGMLNPDGAILVEHGYDQEKGVKNIFEENGLVNVRCIYDFGGNPRVTIGTPLGGLNG